MKINDTMNKVVFSGVCGWTILGFKRGIDSYKFNFLKDELDKNKKSELDKNKKSESPRRPLYINKAYWGVVGAVFYITPVLCFVAAYKEIYRLEVNLRGLEDEKKTRFYNEIF
jgi:hypothetical protein